MEQTIAEVRQLKRGLLKVGTTKTYARYLMPTLITRFRAVYPEIKFILDEGSSSDIANSLLDLRNELAVVATHGEVKGVTTLPFRNERVILFAAPDHPLAQKGSISFQELAGHFVILKEQTSSTHKVVSEAFERHGIIPNVLVETSNLEFIKEMVERGEGVSFLVWSAISEEIEQGLIKPIHIKDEKLVLQREAKNAILSLAEPSTTLGPDLAEPDEAG